MGGGRWWTCTFHKLTLLLLCVELPSDNNESMQSLACVYITTLSCHVCFHICTYRSIDVV